MAIDLNQNLQQQLDAAFDIASNDFLGPGLAVMLNTYCPSRKTWAAGFRPIVKSYLDNRKYIIRVTSTGCKDVFNLYFLDALHDPRTFSNVMCNWEDIDTTIVEEITTFFRVYFNLVSAPDGRWVRYV
jgi:hypothetical protein